ncbi:MAG: DUF5034 domain-containing protein [Bacteroidales bacterium]|nr:DUF5034 domain-containing protein [Bacteroidales bacterium]MCF8456740.1 DUF5034 domain-containing protein [Bacteroidales bacterium]
MIKKVSVILLVIFGVAIAQSCCTEEYEYYWEDFEVRILDNSGTGPVIAQSPQINKDAFGLRVKMATSIPSLAQNFRIINECRATSCAHHYTRTNDLESITIETLSDYSDEYLALADITHLFMARASDQPESSYISLDNMVLQINESNFMYEEEEVSFDLYLIDTTCTGGIQNFEISLGVSNGRAIKHQSGGFVLH